MIEMPVKNITTCTFGGSELTTLYVTTASSQVRESGWAAGCLRFSARSVGSLRTGSTTPASVISKASRGAPGH